MATSRSKKPNPQPKTFQDLVREVFKTSAGSQLLEELHRIYVDRNQFNADPYHTAHRTGEAALVIRLSHLANTPPLEDDLEYTDDRASDGTDDN